MDDGDDGGGGGGGGVEQNSSEAAGPVDAAPASPLLTAFPAPAFPLTSRLAAERVLWIDLEMTNIVDVARGRIMEVGAVVTGPAMEWLHADEERGVCTAYHRVIRLSEAELSDVSEWSRVHHAKVRPGAGLSLLELCARSGFSLREVEDDLVALVRTHGRGRPMMLAGSSIGCDRAFIDAHMPRLASVLHHRSIDVSTVLELCRRMYPGFRVPAPPAPPGAQHTAMGDILSSLRLMHFLQNTIFMPVLLPVLPHQGASPAPASADGPHHEPDRGLPGFSASFGYAAQPRMPAQSAPFGAQDRAGGGYGAQDRAGGYGGYGGHCGHGGHGDYGSSFAGSAANQFGGDSYRAPHPEGFGQPHFRLAAFEGARSFREQSATHAAAAAPGPRPALILRQAPPVHSAAAPAAQPYPLRSPLLAATAAHGFPMPRRPGGR
jgi:oligoribonuclease